MRSGRGKRTQSKSLPQHMKMTIRDEIWVGTQSQTISIVLFIIVQSHILRVCLYVSRLSMLFTF
uniref:Uncharacterized protein n=1 Tax=Macaca fascicularis TaxID=9541 RepID=A0A7N9IBJ0_MACFA